MTTPNTTTASNPGQKQKIVILGGGVSALTTAFELTTPEGWQDKYDITIYQMGWRLGGKGATGRDPENPQRVLEHGLHVWFGCYHNAFHLMWKCYEALQRPPGSPMSTVQDAFDPQPFAVYEEFINGQWEPWSIEFPTNSSFPGVPPDPSKPDDVPFFPSLWDFVEEILQLLWRLFNKVQDQLNVLPPAVKPAPPQPFWLAALHGQFGSTRETLLNESGAEFLEYALKFAGTLGKDVLQHQAQDHSKLIWLAKQFAAWAKHKLEPYLYTNSDLRHLYVLIDLGMATIAGLIGDGVIFNGLNSLDKYDLRQWLSNHGASDIALQSGAVNAIYDSFFAYNNGDQGNRQQGIPGQPDFAAGAALSCILLLFTYKGAIMFKMRAGTGDTVIAPLYEVLMRRGVKVKFFHRVRALHTDGQQVDSIDLGRQVDLNVAEYNPLIMVRGIPCWPANPRYEQIVQGEALRQSKANLESRWTDWQDVGTVTLKAGVDYDKVILSIGISELPYICQELITRSAKWQAMIANLPTVITQSAQLWFTPTLAEMGWTMPPPMLSGYADDFSSWADVSQIAYWENRPAGQSANTVYISSATLKDDKSEIPPPSDHDYPQEAWDRVYANAVEFLSHQAGPLWPIGADANGQLKWENLVAPADKAGSDRLKAQFIRVNIDPTERYDLSPSGISTQCRIKPYDTGYANLYMCGTWTYNFAYNMSCMEVAVMSGMQVSRAICGYPVQIAGESLT